MRQFRSGRCARVLASIARGRGQIVLLALIAVMLLHSSGLGAQDLAQLRALADSLRGHRRAAEVAYRERLAADSARRAAAFAGASEQQVVRVGSLVIVADTQFAAAAERIANELWPGIEAAFGSSSAALSDIHLALGVMRVTNDSGVPVPAGVEATASFGGERSTRVHGLSLSRKATVRDVMALWSTAASAYMIRLAGPAGEWIDTGIPTQEFERDVLLRSQLSNMVLRYGDRARECVEHVLNSCVSAFGLGVDADAGAAAVPGFTRSSLALVAVEVGGPGAWTRLTAPGDAGMAARLESASGIPLDSLLAEWLARIHKARPAPADTPVGTVAAAVFWTVLLGAAATRSSRWR